MGIFAVAHDKCKMKKCYFTSDTLVGMEIWIKPVNLLPRAWQCGTISTDSYLFMSGMCLFWRFCAICNWMLCTSMVHRYAAGYEGIEDVQGPYSRQRDR
jgi:hypothetical protein